jgi:excinuclease ABC subunit C
MIKSQDLKKYHLPDAPGVYFFKAGNRVLYIGKATSLKDRVKSYFSIDLISTRGPLLVDLIYKANKIDFIKTDSVLEAVILEANLIKKHQPKYNTKEKDNKSFNYVVITKEDFPRVLIVRGREIDKGLPYVIKNKFGPFTNGTALKSALKIVRHIFPFRDRCVPHSSHPCFNYQIGLCPGICTDAISKRDYQRVIRNIKLFFEGKKSQVIRNLKKEMKAFAKRGEYENAGQTRNKIFSLNHIQDVALLPSLDKEGLREVGESFRIEAYDAAHLSGTNNVGVMVVMERGEYKKSDYRKFKIQNSKGNDTGALAEMLNRRLGHAEWPYPNLVVVDGGLAQLNIARKITRQHRMLTPIVAVTKDDHHKSKAIIGDEAIVSKYKSQILQINNEAHRFAVKYHRSKSQLKYID